MYYVNYDNETGDILGVYPSTVDFDDVPSPKIAITDEQYNNIGDGYYIVQSGQLVQSIPPDYSDTSDLTEEEQNPTGEGQIAELQNEYLEHLSRLKRAYTAASIMDETILLEEIRNDYRALLEEFTDKAMTIEEGGSGVVSTNNYCVMCGTVTEDGVCPNCHWRQ